MPGLHRNSYRTKVIALLLCPALLPAAQTASTVFIKDPIKAYYAIKSVLQSDYPSRVQSNIGDQIQRYNLDNSCLEQSNIDLFDSPWPDTDDGPNDNIHFLSMLAAEILTYKSDLHKLGYPEQVWRPLLVAYEKKQLAAISAELENSQGLPSDYNEVYGENSNNFVRLLSSVLNTYRVHHNPKLVKLVSSNDVDCGISLPTRNYPIKTEPPGGTVLFLPGPLGRYCKALGFNSDDPKSCDFWRPAPWVGLLIPASQDDFRYWAYWPDGSETRGIFHPGKDPKPGQIGVDASNVAAFHKP